MGKKRQNFCKGYYCGTSGRPQGNPRTPLGRPSVTCPQYIVSTIPEALPPQGFVSSTIYLFLQSCPYSPLSTKSPYNFIYREIGIAYILCLQGIGYLYIIIHYLTSDSDPYQAYADYFLYIGRKLYFKKNPIICNVSRSMSPQGQKDTSACELVASAAGSNICTLI